MTSLQLRANALIKRGSMYMQQQQPQLSTQDFNMAAEIDPRNADVYHHRGQVIFLCIFSLASFLPLTWLWVFENPFVLLHYGTSTSAFWDCNNNLLCRRLLYTVCTCYLFQGFLGQFNGKSSNWQGLAGFQLAHLYPD